MKLRDIVNQLAECNYQCEAGPLVNNTAFISLRALAEMETPEEEACRRQGSKPEQLSVCHACDGTGFVS